jgi:hypothetical protein
LGALGFAVYLLITVPAARLGILAIVLGVILARVGAWWQLRRAVVAFRRAHGDAGRDLLIVYSASPDWQDYIESQWLIQWQHRVVTLNRSAPAWQRQPEVALWRQLTRGGEHTPVAIIVPATRRPSVVRFYTAFKDRKHGNATTLHDRERELASALEFSPGDV